MTITKNEAIKIVGGQNWSTHKKKSIKGQILALNERDIDEFMRRVLAESGKRYEPVGITDKLSCSEKPNS